MPANGTSRAASTSLSSSVSSFSLFRSLPLVAEGARAAGCGYAGLTSAAPSKRAPWVSKKVTLSVPGSVTLNAKPNDGFSPIEVAVSNSAMSRPR